MVGGRNQRRGAREAEMGDGGVRPRSLGTGYDGRSRRAKVAAGQRTKQTKYVELGGLEDDGGGEGRAVVVEGLCEADGAGCPLEPPS